MFEKIARDYFTFSRKERNAVLVLTFLIVIIFLLPRFFPKSSATISETDLKIISAQAQTNQSAVGNKATYSDDLAGIPAYASKIDKDEYTVTKTALFRFDPNNLSASDWKKLGLRDRTIATIHNYLAKGGKFRRKEDLAKIYGLDPQLANKLMPFVAIKAPVAPVPVINMTVTAHDGTVEPKHPYYSKPARALVDINDADTSMLIALPGIGSKLAGRIISFRQKLGGFYSVNQVAEIYGLPDSVFQRLRPMLSMANNAVNQMNINTAELEALKQHPYIRWNLATAIVEYRRQHGNYQSLDELKNIALVTSELFLKIAPYLKVEQ